MSQQQPIVVLGTPPWTLGAFIAILVIIGAFVLALTGQMDFKIAGFFMAVGFARLL